MSSSEESERRETSGRGSRRMESEESTSWSHTGGEGGLGGTRQAEATRGEAEDNVRHREADPRHDEARQYGGQSGSQNANEMSREQQGLFQTSHGAAEATMRAGHANGSGNTHGQEHETNMAASRAARNPLLGGMPPPTAARTAVQSWWDQYGQRDPRAFEAQLRMGATSLFPPLYQHPQPPWFGQHPANMPYIGNYQTAPSFGDGTAFASLLRDLPQVGGLSLQHLRLGAAAISPPAAAAASYGGTAYDYSGAALRLNPPQNVARYPSQTGGSGSTSNDHPSMKLNRVKKRGILEPFPERLHRLLREVEAAGQSDIISFTEDGRAFEIHKPTDFFRDICQVYFRQSRLSSFKRQLNLYGFELIARGPNKGRYFHEYFQRDRPEIVRQIRRTHCKSKKKKSANNAPDFYSMPPITSHEEAERKAASSNGNGSGGSADDGDKKMRSSDSRKTDASDSNGSGFYSDMRPMGYSEEESERNRILISNISERGVEEIEKEMARTNSGSTEDEEQKGMEIATHSGSNEEEEEEQGAESRSS